MEEESRLRGCNINHNFFRLAYLHVRHDSNGLFGSRTAWEKGQKNDGIGILKHGNYSRCLCFRPLMIFIDSWCCFKIKQSRKFFENEQHRWDIKYIWQQPSVYISWNSKDLVTLVLCMDMPPALHEPIQRAWDEGLAQVQDPYEWYCLIVENIISLYDESVWKLRDFVREDVEKVCTESPSQRCTINMYQGQHWMRNWHEQMMVPIRAP